VEAYLELLDRHRLAVISADIRSKLDPFKQTTLVSPECQFGDRVSAHEVVHCRSRRPYIFDVGDAERRKSRNRLERQVLLLGSVALVDEL
jgi:hypothetical protein